MYHAENKKGLIMPLQPFIRFQTDNYERQERFQKGISHFYQFSQTGHDITEIDAVPDGSIDLLFNIGEKDVHTYISGTVLGAKRWVMGDHKDCFGVRFLPGQGVLPEELTIDMLINTDLEVKGDLFGGALVERIAETDSFEERCEIFERAYMELLTKKNTEDLKKKLEEYLLQRIVSSNGTVTIEELAEETNYSACYIRRIFKEYNGISPKQFARFIRFQYLLRNMNGESGRYDQLALDCGYYDEAHMMKEFKSYAGVTMDSFQNLIEKRGQKI